MEKSEIKRILSSPISFVRESTQKEAEIFQDKKNAWFYTFGLASGQQFVGCIFNHEDPRVNFRPISEHNLLPDLQEILWGYDCQIYFGPGLSDRRIMKVFVKEGISEKNKEFYEECLGAKPSEKLIKCVNKGKAEYYIENYRRFDGGRQLLNSHPLRDKALELKETLIRQAEASKAISVAEKTIENAKKKLEEATKKLNQILVPQKTNNLTQQKLKERRQNG